MLTQKGGGIIMSNMIRVRNNNLEKFTLRATSNSKNFKQRIHKCGYNSK